ncbi:50S ribosomal protein L4 [Candidatus Annandia adelgestsuga]|uniref:Large ribosomal subunit protein uL4 n=1 Tax=Candidatus Annandia adelgestsuga TaxID=1302411 RepID=A0A3S5HNW5_9ENTR|nr:50S ribosomal protein L4 [Candidatus Annandia adelgestsuga]AZP36221.1 50S ribosomal protein L4 [Candidatus Annandia adelgestsuga]
MIIMLYDNKKKVKISNKIFNQKFNKTLLHQIIISYLLKSRQGTHSQKNRSLVSGSKRKPWKQKGTGNARAGSRKSPIWRGGGVTFASKFKNYNNKVNKKMHRKALKIIFSELIKQKRLLIFDKFYLPNCSTKKLVNKIKNINFKKILIIINNYNKNIVLSSRNLYRVNLCYLNSINLLKLLSCDKIIITLNSIRKIENYLK